MAAQSSDPLGKIKPRVRPPRWPIAAVLVGFALSGALDLGPGPAAAWGQSTTYGQERFSVQEKSGEQANAEGKDDQPPALTGYVAAEIKMGVRFRISLYCVDEALAERAFAAAFAEIGRLESIFSDYDPASETRRIDAQPCDKPLELSPDLARLLHRSAELHRQTDGYFDVTLGTLTKLWRIARRTGQPPASEDVAAAAARSGARHLERGPDGALVKRSPGFELDFGGIAKGDAADQVIRLLASEFGITRVLVDASGDLVAGEAPPGQPGWIVGLSRPAGDPSRLERLYLRQAALASSGDATQFLETDQGRWSHLIDPRQQEPVIGQNLTLVLAADGATADAWASALAVCPADMFAELTCREPFLAAKRYQRSNPASEINMLESASWEPTISHLQVRAPD